MLRERAPRPFQTPERGSKLAPFKDYVAARFLASGLSAVRLFEEIKAQGYTGSVTILRRFIRTLRAGQAQKKATVRFETPAGQQAQVDWACCGQFKNPEGRMVKVYALVMILGFSRMVYSCFVTSMDLATLMNCPKAAFEIFGGLPKEVLYDNMKQVRLSLDKWNPLAKKNVFIALSKRRCLIAAPPGSTTNTAAASLRHCIVFSIIELRSAVGVFFFGVKSRGLIPTC